MAHRRLFFGAKSVVFSCKETYFRAQSAVYVRIFLGCNVLCHGTKKRIFMTQKVLCHDKDKILFMTQKCCDMTKKLCHDKDKILLMTQKCCDMTQRNIFIYKICCNDGKKCVSMAQKCQDERKLIFMIQKCCFKKQGSVLCDEKSFVSKCEQAFFLLHKRCYDTNVYNGAIRLF